ncbi:MULTISPECIES: macro domain-containing protein [unclassified Rhizobium]|uniref:macro domain-containing protein n=1 Tax=unclassified Rhizobium TaxID=2613769 RepID=UPI001ADA04F1|nr:MULTISPECIES: macro domain-containing protein [unclassified Rhizobium]MBO9122212.1 macro domain-containing protein [Rhizobium sp. 16-488-2b]MBO9172718.1 macro domain-containing protein [Rhizobium sp. 16-488-2a]
MLVYRRTDLFSSPAQTLVNTVNCVGVMGKGIAKEFKEREPDMFAAYKRICDQKLLSPGKLWLWRGPNYMTLNFPTKMHWRGPSKLEWIEAGLKKFVSTFERTGIKEISFPRLGCGNGGLDWDEVRPLMEKYLTPLPIDIYVHDYTKDIGLPEHLGHVAEQIKHTAPSTLSFDVFFADLVRAVDLSGDDLVDISTDEPIHAQIIEDNLRLETDKASWTFERDDLRAVWLTLLRGLLTKEKAGWLNDESGSPLLSLVSLLPQVRPIEILRQDEDEPELAVELAPTNRGSAVVPRANAQTELSWH